ncbi:hypothetical protein PspLS_12128 [Pyricularia sp. CBS 133598]|nr:hypothetical protein PspLS_12128 [Pyricularia sp. CBS 133598]
MANMATEKQPFRVVIVGGGIGGLALANMLQEFDMEYVVLEAYTEIAPAVGASIGLFPNGLRILDQIGCYEPLRSLVGDLNNHRSVRDQDGQALSVTMDPQVHEIKRHGYPNLFMNRQWLMQSLYDHLKEKDRVLLGKRVTRIDQIHGAARVYTEDGSVFEGSIAIGADGIHSVVRKELNRLAQKERPKDFPVDQEDRIPAFYKCCFGISQDVDGWPERHVTASFNQNISCGAISGPGKRIYWFLFERFPETKRGKAVPKFSDQDREAFAQDHAEAHVTDTVKFRNLYDKKISASLTPLHEMVYQTWFHKRVLLIGDAAHKPNPMTGQGGNGAIETAAELMNAILDERDSRPTGLQDLSDDDIERMFLRVQTTRFSRSQAVVKDSYDRLSLLTNHKPRVSAVAKAIMRYAPSSYRSLAGTSDIVSGGNHIHKLPLPQRSRAIPYEDERPAKPVRAATNKIIRTLFAITNLTFAFLAQEPRTAASLWQNVTPVLLSTVEGYRYGHTNSLLSMPSITALGLHTLGSGRVLPVYSAVHGLVAFRQPPGRRVELTAAKSIVRTIALGGALAPLVKLALERRLGTAISWRDLTQLTSLFPLLVWGLNKLSRKAHAKAGNPSESEALDSYKIDDMPYLRALYGCAFAAQAAAHLASGGLANLAGLASGSVYDVARSLVHSMSTSGSAYHSLLITNMFAIWDLRALGYVTTPRAIRAALGVAVGQALVGPGATWAGLWWWRDEVYASSIIE